MSWTASPVASGLLALLLVPSLAGRVQGDAGPVAQGADRGAVTVLPQAVLDERGVRDLTDLQRAVPSLHVGRVGATPVVAIRGFGGENLEALGEPGVVTEIDGVPLVRPSIEGLPLYDLEAVRVHRGPQGTGGGRGSTAGKIAISPAPPTEGIEAYGDVTFGGWRQLRGRAVLNLPILADEKLLSRTSFVYVDRDGYQRNSLTARSEDRADDAEDLYVRGQLLSRPAEGWTLRGTASYAQQRGVGPARNVIGPQNRLLAACPDDRFCPPEVFGPPGEPRTTANPRTSWVNTIGDRDDAQTFGAGDLRWTLPPVPVLGGSELGFVGAWFENRRAQGDCIPVLEDPDTLRVCGARVPGSEFFDRVIRRARGIDLDGSNAPFSYLQTNRVSAQRSFELFLRSPSARPLRWRLGFYHLRERSREHRFSVLDATAAGAVSFRVREGTESDEDAFYGEATWSLLEDLEVSGGLRWTRSRKRQEQSVPIAAPGPPGVGLFTIGARTRASVWTPRGAWLWRFAPGHRLALSVAKGFKAGGFDPPIFGSRTYPHETSWSYEIRSRHLFEARRLAIDLTLFWTDYRNYPACRFAVEGAFCDLGEARSRGVEIESQWEPVSGLRLDAVFTYTDTTVNDLVAVDPLEPRFLPAGCFPSTDAACAINPLAGVGQDLRWQLPRAPRHRVSLGAAYDFVLTDFGLWGILTPRVDYHYRNRTSFRIFHREQFGQAALHRADARVVWRGDDSRWVLEAFVENLSDEDELGSLHVFSPSFDEGAALAYGTYLPPRTWGVRAEFRFGS